MKKKFTAAIIGLGGRGYVYANLFKAHQDEFEVVAICDRNTAQIDKIQKVLNLPDSAVFTDETEFFAEKRADVLVIATWDLLHFRQTVTAMKLGYHILLEKPVSDSEEELNELLSVQKETGSIVVVCHVLRYSAPYMKMSQLIKDGTLGTLMAVDAEESLAYWHLTHDYVRIQGRNIFGTFPTILAKCCHDLDYIQHFAGSKCDTVSSVGGLSYFRPENAPAGATERCLDCPHVDTCPYSGKRVYIERWKKAGSPTFTWPYNKVSLKDPNTEEDLYKGVENSEFGQCVFFCGVHANPHVVDRQTLQMTFQNGVLATFRLLMGGQPCRHVHLFGTKAEVIMDEVADTIVIKRYGEENEVLSIPQLQKEMATVGGHGGGDAGMINDLYSILTGEKQDYTSLEESAESHRIGIKAEESRLNGGVTLKVH